jgi:pyrroloquinoline quinone biosynthesis protein B
MRVKVLGSAAGGGFPQWNCGCANCNRLRAGVLKGHPRSQAQVAVSPAPGKWLLLNASPDLRQQILEYPELAPPEAPRSTPIQAIILTSAEVDCVMGLLHLREFQSLCIFATRSVQRALTEENSFFRVLARPNPPVPWEVMPLEKPVTAFCDREGTVSTNFSCTAHSLRGTFPDYVSDELRIKLREDEAVIGLECAQDGKQFFYAPNLPVSGESWKHYVTKSGLAMLDATFWTDEELIQVRAGGKSAREMGHLPLSGENGLVEQMREGQSVRRVLIHLNNTNPAVDEESAANRALRDAGWEIAYDGMEIDF